MAAGQVQKEFYVNEAHALIDALMHAAIEGIANVPPDAPAEGTCWLIGESPTGAWTGQAGNIAARQAGNWLLIPPCDGMHVTDRSTGQVIRRLTNWHTPTAPAVPAGGTTIDHEARVAIEQLIAALSSAGIFPAA